MDNKYKEKIHQLMLEQIENLRSVKPEQRSRLFAKYSTGGAVGMLTEKARLGYCFLDIPEVILVAREFLKTQDLTGL
jgi:hypothetical protein